MRFIDPLAMIDLVDYLTRDVGAGQEAVAWEFVSRPVSFRRSHDAKELCKESQDNAIEMILIQVNAKNDVIQRG